MFSLGDLPRRNLFFYTGRTVALFSFSLAMAAALFGASMVLAGVQRGLEETQGRLGADLIVTPAGSENAFDPQTVLLQAEPGYFYMERGKFDEIAAIPGVEKASPQRYMASAKTGCCSARLQMIGFDPATDFVIRPWLKDSQMAEEMDFMDVVIGSNVSVYDGDRLRFYDKECRVVGQFAPTGSTLDNCVYMNFDTVNVLIVASQEKRLNLYAEYQPEDVISAVMVKVAPGADAEAVAAEIRAGVAGVNVAVAAQMISGIRDGIARITQRITIFAGIFWGISLLMTLLLFALTMHERRREFAALLAMGASRAMISRLAAQEALLVNLAGGAAGIALAAVVVVLFRALISQQIAQGFLLPSAGTAFLLCGLVFFSSAFAAALSAWCAVQKIGKIDASIVLKEGD